MEHPLTRRCVGRTPTLTCTCSRACSNGALISHCYGCAVRDICVTAALFAIGLAVVATFAGVMLLWSSRSGGPGADGFTSAGIAVLMSSAVLYVVAVVLLLAARGRPSPDTAAGGQRSAS